MNPADDKSNEIVKRKSNKQTQSSSNSANHTVKIIDEVFNMNMFIIACFVPKPKGMFLTWYVEKVFNKISNPFICLSVCDRNTRSGTLLLEWFVKSCLTYDISGTFNFFLCFTSCDCKLFVWDRDWETFWWAIVSNFL